MVETFETSHLLTSLLNLCAYWNTERREKARVLGFEGNETAGVGKYEYLLLCMVDTFETSHLLKSLSKWEAW